MRVFGGVMVEGGGRGVRWVGVRGGPEGSRDMQEGGKTDYNGEGKQVVNC